VQASIVSAKIKAGPGKRLIVAPSQRADVRTLGA
jgi:hypothetical protein